MVQLLMVLFFRTMFGTQHLLTFLIAAVALNRTPAQDILYIIGRCLSQGWRAGSGWRLWHMAPFPAPVSPERSLFEGVSF